MRRDVSLCTVNSHCFVLCPLPDGARTICCANNGGVALLSAVASGYCLKLVTLVLFVCLCATYVELATLLLSLYLSIHLSVPCHHLSTHLSIHLSTSVLIPTRLVLVRPDAPSFLRCNVWPLLILTLILILIHRSQTSQCRI